MTTRDSGGRPALVEDDSGRPASGRLPSQIVYSIVPPTGIALWALQRYGLIAPISLWSLAFLLGGGVLLTTLVDRWFEARPSRLRLHARIASQVAVATAVIYLIGWGPLLATGYLLVVQENISRSGGKVWKPAALWCVAGLACGQIAIALGAVPCFVDEPAVHGLALLAGLALVFVIRLMGETALAKERAEARLRNSEERFRSLVQNSSDVIVVLEADLQVRYVSEAVNRLLGFQHISSSGTNAVDLVHVDDRVAAARIVAQLRRASGSTATFELRIRNSSGEWRWIEAIVTNLLDHPSVKGIVANLHDVTARRQLETTLEFGAYHDSLTGLANRRAYLELLEQALARGRRSGTAVAVLFCDLDRFKLVNDSLGHAVGDQLLVAISERLVAAVRPEDVVARFAGDEFAILLADVGSPEHAAAAAERALASLKAPVLLEGRSHNVTASIGIAVSDRDDEPGELLREADLAMYQAKERGRSGWALFDTEVERRVLDRIALETELWRAVENGELVAMYQPEVDVATGAIVGVEALVRWYHPERGLLVPDVFVPLAEESDLILSIDRGVLRSACAALSDWRSMGVAESFTMSVNLSPRWLHDGDRVREIQAIVAASDVQASDIQLEITENVALGEGPETTEMFEELRAAGFRVAIDDFGAGYSSMAYLRRFHVDALKLDRSFVARADSSPRDAAILRAMVSVGHALGTRLIAEGVERTTQLELLRGWGCHGAQGYLFSPALPAAELLPLLRAEYAAEVEGTG